MAVRGAGLQWGGVCVHMAPGPFLWEDGGTGVPLCHPFVSSSALLQHHLGLGGAGHPYLDQWWGGWQILDPTLPTICPVFLWLYLVAKY